MKRLRELAGVGSAAQKPLGVLVVVVVVCQCAWVGVVMERGCRWRVQGGGSGFRSAAVTRLITSTSSSPQTNGRAETLGTETDRRDDTQDEE